MRQHRILRNNAFYHTMARINRQEYIFENEQFKIIFQEIIVRAKSKYNFQLRNFCIMGNHVHFDISPAQEESLSKIMQWILSVFAVRFNKINKYKGHLWYDRFKSKIIEDYRQFINTFKYIANNPVRAGLCTHPSNWAFNGITHILNKYFQIIDRPDHMLEMIIREFLDNFDIDHAKEVKTDIGFYSRKRKK